MADTGSGGPIPPSGGEVELRNALVREIIDAVRSDQLHTAQQLVKPLHPADIADLLEWIPQEDRQRLVDALRYDFDGQILAELDDTVAEQVMDQLGPAEVAEVVATMETDDAVDLVEDLNAEDQQELLAALPADDRALIEEGLSYPEDSAGRLMQPQAVAVPREWRVGQALDYLREVEELPEDFYDLLLVDHSSRPIGTVPLGRLVRTASDKELVAIMRPEEMRIIPADMDQEEVAFLFRQRDLISAPVVDSNGCLVGVITVDDVVDVIVEEHEEDIMRLGGVGAEDDMFETISDTTRSRFFWLMVHLIAAILASAVISIFANTIEELVALAILMPIVATMGGTAGIQALTVAVRAIAMKELTTTNALRAIGKEILVCGLNGMLFAFLIGCVAWVWFGSLALGGVIGLAIVINLVVAGFTGSALPVILQKVGFDPAVASSALLTSITDVVGFYVFLALSAMLLL